MGVLTPLDWGVLAVYLVAIIGFGVWVGRGNRQLTDFFLAGREMKWWAVGLSVMATQISAITIISTTAQAYTDGMRFLVVYFPLPFAMVVLCLTLVPFFYRARVFTAYEYLERRFGPHTRTLTSVLFLLSRGLSVGVTLYAPSVVLAVLLGWSEPATILLMGVSTIGYVAWGGNRSVIWTDVAQMGLIWLGIFVCLGVAIAQLPAGISLRDALALVQATGRTEIVDTTPSLTKPYTLWSGLIGGFFLMLSYFGTDQSQVQRYLSGASLRESRLSLLFNAALKVPMQFLILLTGALVFVFYHFHPPPALWEPSARTTWERQADPALRAALDQRYGEAVAARKQAALAVAAARHEGREAPLEAYRTSAAEFEAARGEVLQAVKTLRGVPKYTDTNYIFTSYIVENLPAGLVGLVIAVIFAAAMSTLSGEFNSLATATVIDVYRRFLARGEDEARDLRVSRIATAAWGGFACLVALKAGQLGSAIEVVNRFGSLFYGSILGVFALAVFVPRAGGTAAVTGLVAGMTTVGLVASLTPVHFLWYNAIGTAAVLLVGTAVSIAVPRATSD